MRPAPAEIRVGDVTADGAVSGASKSKRRTWFIDVCKTCGRIAHWPFCEHRTDGMSNERWYETVRVREAKAP